MLFAEMYVVYVQSESKHQPELILGSEEQVHTCCPFECTVLGAEEGKQALLVEGWSLKCWESAREINLTKIHQSI